MSNYKIIDGKIYKEVEVSEIEQLRIKIEQVCKTITPILAEIERLKEEIKIKENRVQQYIQALEKDAELIKAVFPDKAKQLGFLT